MNNCLNYCQAVLSFAASPRAGSPSAARVMPQAGSPRDCTVCLCGGIRMLWAFALAVFVLWIVAFALFHAGASLMPIVLVTAAAAALYDLFTDRHRAV